jgi:hypothetical protein
MVRDRWKRKELYLDLAAGDNLLAGWIVPFIMDTNRLRR